MFFRSNRKEPVTISGVIVAETKKAILFDDGIMREWVPKSQILDMKSREGGLYEITIPRWLLEEKFG